MANTKKEITLQNLKSRMYYRENYNEDGALERYNKVKDDFDKFIKKCFTAQDFDALAEAQSHMENLLMECVELINNPEADATDPASLDDTLNTLFVKYGYNNRYNISVLKKGEDVVILKGRIRNLDNVKRLIELGFFKRTSNM